MSDLVLTSSKLLREHGGRMTSQRRRILEALEDMSSHPTAIELYEHVHRQDPSLHLSTVYRTLRWLEAEGLVTSRWFGPGERIERFDPSNPSDHHHFVCSACKNVIEFDSLLVNTIKAQFELHSRSYVETASITFYGLCEKCFEKENRITPRSIK